MVLRSRESKVVKPALGAILPSSPSNYLCHQAAALPHHDGCLWLEEPIPITDQLIHRITLLPCKGEDPIDISKGKSKDLAMAIIDIFWNFNPNLICR